MNQIKHPDSRLTRLKNFYQDQPSLRTEQRTAALAARMAEIIQHAHRYKADRRMRQITAQIDQKLWTAPITNVERSNPNFQYLDELIYPIMAHCITWIANCMLFLYYSIQLSPLRPKVRAQERQDKQLLEQSRDQIYQDYQVKEGNILDSLDAFGKAISTYLGEQQD